MISFDEVIRTALAAAAYLREEADFNRSWADGRRGQPLDTPAYKARRIEAAEEREAWAEAIESLTAVCPPTILCSDCPAADYPTDKTRCLPCPRRKACLDTDLLPILSRWGALDGGVWNVERYNLERITLLADTHAALAKLGSR